MENLDIRLMVSESGMTYRDIARAMGIGANYLSRIMRKPLSQYHRERILKAIGDLKETDWSGDADGKRV